MDQGAVGTERWRLSWFLQRTLSSNKKNINNDILAHIKLPNISPEIFHIILIKDNFNHSNYHLYIKRSYSKLSFEEKIYDNHYIENKHDINKFDEYKTGPEEIQIKYIKLIQSINHLVE